MCSEFLDHPHCSVLVNLFLRQVPDEDEDENDGEEDDNDDEEDGDGYSE
jgi:hypothetical protein